jgi:hypothetical protein
VRGILLDSSSTSTYRHTGLSSLQASRSTFRCMRCLGPSRSFLYYYSSADISLSLHVNCFSTSLPILPWALRTGIFPPILLTKKTRPFALVVSSLFHYLPWTLLDSPATYPPCRPGHLALHLHRSPFCEPPDRRRSLLPFFARAPARIVCCAPSPLTPIALTSGLSNSSVLTSLMHMPATFTLVAIASLPPLHIPTPGYGSM